MLVARRIDHLEAVKARIAQAGGRAAVVGADVVDRDAMRRAFDVAEAAFGTVDILINNAGVAHAGRAVELPTDLLINKSLTVMGAFSVDSRAYTEAIRLIEAGRFPLERMHTHTFGLEEVPRAIETLAGEVPGEDAVHVAIVPGA